MPSAGEEPPVRRCCRSASERALRHFMFLERPELGSPLAEALELSRTKAGSSPGDAACARLPGLFAKAYLLLETRRRSESSMISAAAAARVLNSVLRPLATASRPRAVAARLLCESCRLFPVVS
jgi:hypothetical protein